MATYTLANLQTDIRNYTEVGSTVLSDTILERLIKNAEQTIFRAVDMDDERFYATSNCIIGNRYVSIPSDCRVIRYIQLLNDNVSPNIQVFLEQRDVSFMAEYYNTPSTASTSLPKYWANWNETCWVVAPTPDTAYEITMAFNKDPVSLTDSSKSTTGTYISNKYPDLLLYGCLVNTYGYLKGPQDMLQYYQAAYKEALESYAIEQIGQRRRSEYGDGVIRAQLISKSPSSN
jgi:hypothetical protein